MVQKRMLDRPTSCSDSAIWNSSSSSESSSISTEFLPAPFVWSIECEDLCWGFPPLPKAKEEGAMLTITGILIGWLLSSVCKNHSRKPVMNMSPWLKNGRCKCGLKKSRSHFPHGSPWKWERKGTYQRHCWAFEEDNVVEMLEDNQHPNL